MVPGCLFQSTGLKPPDLLLTWPSWLGVPSSNTMFGLCLLVYYLSVSGLTYDILNSPPAFGIELDANGNAKPIAILKYQVNQQYLVEGFTAGFMMLITGSGLMILDKTNTVATTKMANLLMVGLGLFFVVAGPFSLYTFFRIKWPGYLE